MSLMWHASTSFGLFVKKKQVTWQPEMTNLRGTHPEGDRIIGGLPDSATLVQEAAPESCMTNMVQPGPEMCAPHAYRMEYPK